MTSWIESIDVNDYVKALLDAETKNINKVTAIKLSQLTSQENSLKSRVNAYNQLQSMLDTFKSKIETLTTSFDPIYQASSADTTIATASVEGTPAPGTHTLTVTQLAQAESDKSKVVTSDTDALNMTNTLTVTIGSSNFNVSIDTSDSLQAIADKINTGAAANSMNVTASVVNTGTNEYRLIVSSTLTGTDNQVSLSETGTGSDALSFTALTSAQNAQFYLDGLSYDLPGNTNLIAGLNLTLLKGSGAATTISVSDTNTVSKVQAKIQDVVDSYNDAMTFIARAQASTRSPDSVLAAAQSALKGYMSNNDTLSALGIVAKPYNEVTPIVITFDDGSSTNAYPTGLLKINTDTEKGVTLEDKLIADFQNVKSQLVGSTGAFTDVDTQLEAATGSIWKVLNDVQYGGITTANTQISALDDKIATVNENAEEQKKSLLLKYAKLDLLLNNLKTKTQYISSQLQTLTLNQS